jgi:hypothetical protein
VSKKCSRLIGPADIRVFVPPSTLPTSRPNGHPKLL